MHLAEIFFHSALRPWRAARTAWRERTQQWFDQRSPPTDTLQLTQRNVYILPTRAGWMFAGTLAVLLIASINYQLNLGYVLTFLLAGCGAVSMHITHRQLRGLTLHLRPVAAVFAGGTAALELVLGDGGGSVTARHGLGVKLLAGPAAEGTRAASALTWLDVPAGAQASAHLRFSALKRGRHTLPALHIETRFPFGLFRAWAVWRPAAPLWVYPQPEQPAAPLPAPLACQGGAMPRRFAEGGEFEGVRAYRRGDPLQSVVWKKAAKAMETGGELVSRDNSRAAARHELRLAWQACGALPAEARLSRLAAWVLAAHQRAALFALTLPGHEVPLGQGEAHVQRSLELLALAP